MSGPTVPQAPMEVEVSSRAREVKYEYSLNLAPLLNHLGVTLLVSTYQAGKLVVIIPSGDKPEFAFHTFVRAMGVAVRPDRLAVGTQRQVWLLHSAPDIVYTLAGRGLDCCYVRR